MFHLKTYYRFLTLIVLVAPILVIGQNNKISFSFKDNVSKEGIYGLNVHIQNRTKSLFEDAITSEKGNVQFEIADSVKTIQLSFSGLNYSTVIDSSIDVSYKKRFEFNLKSKSIVLSDVTIQNSDSVEVKGDTVSFSAVSFKTKADQNIGNVIEKLPGIEKTDKELKSEGQTITKVKLNGEVYAQGNTQSALNQIPSDIIAKIEVIDVVSPEDPSVTFKELNLVTKEDSKVRFGKLSGVVGTSNRYRFAGNRYLHKGNHRLTLLADGNNINKEDLLENSLDNLYEGDNSFLGGGLNYVYLNPEKLKVESDVRLNKVDRLQNQSTTQESTVDYLNVPLYQSSDATNISEQFGTINTSATKYFEDKSQFKIRLKYENLDGRNVLESNSFQSLTDSIFDSNNLLDKRMEKSRVISGSTSFKKYFRRNKEDFVSLRKLSSSLKVDQFYTSSLDTLTINSDDSIGRSFLNSTNNRPYRFVRGKLELAEYNDWMLVKYVYTHTSKLQQESLNTYSFLDQEFLAGILDTGMSLHFKANIVSDFGSLRMYKNIGKTQFGLFISAQNLKVSNDRFFPIDNVVNRNYQALLPTFSIVQKKDKHTKLKIILRKSMREPNVNYLTEAVDVSVPLRPRIGNSNLDASKRWNLTWSWRKLKPKQNLKILEVRSSLTSNYIGQNILWLNNDSLINGVLLKEGDQLTSYANFSQQVTSNGSFAYEKFKGKSKFAFKLGYTFDQTPSQFNELERVTYVKRLNSTLYGVLSSSNSLTFNYRLYSSLGSVSEQLLENDNSLFNWYLNLGFRYLAFNRLLLDAHSNSFQVSTSGVDQNNGVNTTVNLSAKYLLKNEKASIEFRIHDLLNQNKEVSLNPEALYTSVERSLLLTRYFMLGASWRF